MSKAIYFDYAATAPFDESLIPVLQGASWANANSLHAAGREARKQLEEARLQIARCLGARQPAEIVFTSGGTESCNTAIKGLMGPEKAKEGAHVIVSSIEHHAVLDAADSLKARGYKVIRLDPNRFGVVEPGALEEAIARIEEGGGSIALVCVMAVNNELGTIQPVRELAEIAHAHKARFFCDCVQALGKLDIQLEQSGVDAASFSAHKIGGPKGCGVLYLRRGARIQPLLHGGGQESGLRSGTSNVPGNVAQAAAIKHAVEQREQVWSHLAELREALLEGVAALELPHALKPTLSESFVPSATEALGASFAGEGAPVVPHIVNLLADGLEGETLVQRLDAVGFAVSSGSACSTGNLDPSHVLTACGIPKTQAYGSLRLSFGAATACEEIDAFLQALPQVMA